MFGIPIRAGDGGVKLLGAGENMWDLSRGKGIPRDQAPRAHDVRRLDVLAEQLLNSSWVPGTRVSYNRWFGTWAQFCQTNRVSCMPAREQDLTRFFTYLACYYSKSTVSIAAAAVVALHRHNGYQHPFSDRVKQLLRGIDKTGLAGVRSQKFIIDQQFVVKMCQHFLGRFPVFDAELFDPRQQARSVDERSIVWMRGVAMILLGLAAGLRAGEVTKLTVCCWERRLLDSIYIHVKLAKNGRNGEGSGAYLYRDSGCFADSFSVVHMMEEFWFPFLKSMGIRRSHSCTHSKHPAAHCSACPPLFPSFPSKPSSCMRAVSVSEITSVVKQWAAKLGYNAVHYSAISFRRGSVSVAAAEKVARNIRKKHCRWRSKGMPDHYTEASVEEQLEFGKALQRAIRKSKSNSGKSVTFHS